MCTTDNENVGLSPMIQAAGFNARLLDDLPGTMAHMAPAIRSADEILFFTKPGLTKNHFLTTEELRYILGSPEILSRTRFVTGFNR